MPRYKGAPLHNQRFTRLLVIKEAKGERAPFQNRTKWQCVCDCGKRVVATAESLRFGEKKSCGCLQRENRLKLGRREGWRTRIVHGQYKTPEYNIWLGMRQRCLNPNNPAYSNYGGRGIRVCKRWSKYKNFLEDMGRRPSAKHSLDRFPDNDGDYKKSNCRWATWGQQHTNKRPRTKEHNAAISRALKRKRGKKGNGK